MAVASVGEENRQVDKLMSTPQTNTESGSDDQNRDELVKTAVKFLQNPKVQSSPLAQKKVFLKSKGLTEKEVEQALSLANVVDRPSVESYKTYIPPNNVPVFISPWAKARDISIVIVFISGAAYGLYHLIKKYIYPGFIGNQRENDKLKILEKKVEELQTSVNQILLNFSCTVKDIHSSTTENQQKLDELLTIVQNNQGSQKLKDNQLFQGMKSEISSIKGLLLNRHSFPPPPPHVQGVPAWQLQSGSSISELDEGEDKASAEGKNGEDKNSSPENSITASNSRTWELVNEDSEEVDAEANSSGV